MKWAEHGVKMLALWNCLQREKTEWNLKTSRMNESRSWKNLRRSSQLAFAIFLLGTGITIVTDLLSKYPERCFVWPCNYYNAYCSDCDECHLEEVQGFSNVCKSCINIVSIKPCYHSSLAYFWIGSWLAKMYLLSNMHHKFWFSLFYFAWSSPQYILISFLRLWS